MEILLCSVVMSLRWLAQYRPAEIVNVYTQEECNWEQSDDLIRTYCETLALAHVKHYVNVKLALRGSTRASAEVIIQVVQ